MYNYIDVGTIWIHNIPTLKTHLRNWRTNIDFVLLLSASCWQEDRQQCVILAHCELLNCLLWPFWYLSQTPLASKAFHCKVPLFQESHSIWVLEVYPTYIKGVLPFGFVWCQNKNLLLPPSPPTSLLWKVTNSSRSVSPRFLTNLIFN